MSNKWKQNLQDVETRVLCTHLADLSQALDTLLHIDTGPRSDRLQPTNDSCALLPPAPHRLDDDTANLQLMSKVRQATENFKEWHLRFERLLEDWAEQPDDVDDFSEALPVLASPRIDKNIQTLVQDETERIEYAYNEETPITGFTSLDEATGGFSRGRLWILRGEKNVGKTGLFLQWLLELNRQNIPVLFISLNESPETLVSRMLSIESGVPAAGLQSGVVERPKWINLANAAGELGDSQLQFVHISSHPTAEQHSVAQNASEEHLEAHLEEHLEAHLEEHRKAHLEEILSIIFECQRRKKRRVVLIDGLHSPYNGLLSTPALCELKNLVLQLNFCLVISTSERTHASQSSTGDVELELKATQKQERILFVTKNAFGECVQLLLHQEGTKWIPEPPVTYRNSEEYQDYLALQKADQDPK